MPIPAACISAYCIKKIYIHKTIFSHIFLNIEIKITPPLDKVMRWKFIYLRYCTLLDICEMLILRNSNIAKLTLHELSIFLKCTVCI